MLATIIKNKIATETTLNIIETFAKVKELFQSLNAIMKTEVELETKMITKLFSINLGEYNYTSTNNAHHSSNRVGGLFLFNGIL